MTFVNTLLASRILFCVAIALLPAAVTAPVQVVAQSPDRQIAIGENK